MIKILLFAFLYLYAPTLYAQLLYSTLYCLDNLAKEAKFNSLTKQLLQDPQNINLLTERVYLYDYTTDTSSNKLGFNYEKYTIHEVLKDLDYIINNMNSSTDRYGNDSKLELLFMQDSFIHYFRDKNPIYAPTQQLVNYIIRLKKHYNTTNIVSWTRRIENRFIYCQDIYNNAHTTTDTALYIQKMLKYADFNALFYPIESSIAFNKRDSYMISELYVENLCMYKFELSQSPILINRAINYLKKLINYNYNIINDKKLHKYSYLSNESATYNIYQYAKRLGIIYYNSKDYDKAKLWLQPTLNDNDNIINNIEYDYHKNKYNNSYIYLLNIAMLNNNISIDKQLEYIFKLLEKEYFENFNYSYIHQDTSIEQYIEYALNTIKPKAIDNPNFYLAYAILKFKNRGLYIDTYNTYIQEVLNNLDKAQSLGLKTYKIDLIKGIIYKELNQDDLAKTFLQQAATQIPKPTGNIYPYYQDNDLDILITALENKVNAYQENKPKPEIPKAIINLAKLP